MHGADIHSCQELWGIMHPCYIYIYVCLPVPVSPRCLGATMCGAKSDAVVLLPDYKRKSTHSNAYPCGAGLKLLACGTYVLWDIDSLKYVNYICVYIYFLYACM